MNALMRCCLLSLLMAYSSARALPVQKVDAVGNLIGATGVVVGSESFNVEFLDGTCVELFTGCDDPTDMVFLSVAAAQKAALALLSTVLVDGPLGAFDSQSGLIFGCKRGPGCVILTPNNFGITYIQTQNAWNAFEDSGGDGLDFTTDVLIEPLKDTTAEDFVTWARWSRGISPIPEPGTTYCLSIAGLILAVTQRRRASVVRHK